MRASVLLLAVGLTMTAVLPLAGPPAPSEDVWRPAPFLTEPPSRLRVPAKSCVTEHLLPAAGVVAAATDDPGLSCAPMLRAGRDALPPLPGSLAVLRL
jgi:hypothetical protein